jgi:hypothetical protein
MIVGRTMVATCAQLAAQHLANADRTSMYSQFSLVRFSSVAFTTTSSKMFDCARNMTSACFPACCGLIGMGKLSGGVGALK